MHSVRIDSNFKNHITLSKPHFRFVPKVQSPYYKEFCRVNYLFNIPWIGIDFFHKHVVDFIGRGYLHDKQIIAVVNICLYLYLIIH